MSLTQRSMRMSTGRSGFGSQSLYGGLGSSARSISSSRSFNVSSAGSGMRSGGGMGIGLGMGIGMSAGGLLSGGTSGLVANEKDAMQNLNSRLSKYLERVHSLEESNIQLEKKIRELSTDKIIQGFDWTIYENTVKPLQSQILSSIMDNSHVALEIDNAKLAAEDFRSKWENELMLRQSVENDIGGLHQLKETYLQLQTGLTNDIGALEDEIAYLKKNHAEELRMLRQQKTSDVQVEVDSKPSINLQEVLNKIREDYNGMVNKNQGDMETWYKVQLETKSVEQAQDNQALEAARHEVSEYRRQMQNLQAEYDAMLGSLGSLEAALADTERRYDQELQGYLFKEGALNDELRRIRNEINQQANNYQQLLNMKMKLEQEIVMYRQLLDGGAQSSISGTSSSSISSGE
uniref:Keratin, type I cytoskeletal 50 kDa-like n=1 Tax=Callorhinchus milii TaxID=7868 RepID=A0A4W3GQE7_CALMI